MEKQLIFKGETDKGIIVEGFFTKKKIGNLFIPVIERIVENDSGDYVDSIEVVKILPQSESDVLNKIDQMCQESLSPEKYEKWEEVKIWLDINRGINKII